MKASVLLPHADTVTLLTDGEAAPEGAPDGLEVITKKLAAVEGGEKVSVSLSKGSVKKSVGQGSGGLEFRCSLTVVVHRIKDAASGCSPDETGRQVKQMLSEQFVSVFEKFANERGCDIFGIGKLLRQKYPSTYLENEGELEKFYRTAVCEVGVECLVE